MQESRESLAWTSPCIRVRYFNQTSLKFLLEFKVKTRPGNWVSFGSLIYSETCIKRIPLGPSLVFAQNRFYMLCNNGQRPRHTMRQIAATRRRDRLLQQIASCDMWKSLSLRSVAQIQTGLNLCDISQRQTKRKRLVAAAVKTRRLVAATCRRDLSHRVSRP